MKIKNLKPNKKNPRKITAKRLEALKKSLAKFGDLSGIVYNRRTKTLIGGHQHGKVFPPDTQIHIEVKHDTPTAAMTVAEGYVMVDGERHKFREVDADETWAMEAMLAANNHGGEFDQDLVKIVLADFPKIDLELAGFDMPKIDLPVASGVLGAGGAGEADSESDEDYVANTPQTEEQIPVENISAAFSETKEKTDIVGKRYVIIIDCKDQAAKDELKEKIKAEVEMSGAKFF